MKSRNEIVSLSKAIDEFLDNFKLSQKVLESRAISAWPQVMGPNIAGFTRSVQFKGKGIMLVHLSSSVLRSELMMHRSRIVKNINDFVGSQVVKELLLKE